MISLQSLATILLAVASLESDGPVSPPHSAAEREAYARYALSNRGDAARGRAVFDDARGAGCAAATACAGRG